MSESEYNERQGMKRDISGSNKKNNNSNHIFFFISLYLSPCHNVRVCVSAIMCSWRARKDDCWCWCFLVCLFAGVRNRMRERERMSAPTPEQVMITLAVFFFTQITGISLPVKSISCRMCPGSITRLISSTSLTSFKVAEQSPGMPYFVSRKLHLLQGTLLDARSRE